MGVVFDKLGFMKRLEGAGAFMRPQGEALSEALHDAVAESAATKLDLGEVRTELKAGLSEVRAEMRARFQEIRTLQAETKVWAVSTGATIVAVLTAMRYFG